MTDFTFDPWGKDGGCNAPPLPPDPDGGELLEELHAAITRYVILPSPEAADAVTLFIAATHAQTAFEHATRLVIKSPIRRCGKTRLQEVCKETVNQPLATINISPAALVRSIDEDDPPTIILDEADTVFGNAKKNSESSEDVRGILNSGHSRGWPYRRWNANSRSMEVCPTFCMAIISGIGQMPDTIEDRAVVIEMRRRAPGESIQQFRSRRAIPPLRDLRDRLHVWVNSVSKLLRTAEPDLPVEDREADVWESLVAVADAAGGDWPDRARRACKVLTAASSEAADGDISERLLADMKKVFGDEDAMTTDEVLNKLREIEEAPWSDYRSRRKDSALNARDLAWLLKHYGVRSKNVRIGDQQAKGYLRADLADPWRRYVPSVPTSQDDETAAPTSGNAWDGRGTDSDPGSVPRSDQQEQTDWDAGTDGTATRPESATVCRNCGESGGKVGLGTGGLCMGCEAMQ